MWDRRSMHLTRPPSGYERIELHSTVQVHDLAGDGPGRIRGKEPYRVRNLLGSAEPTNRYVATLTIAPPERTPIPEFHGHWTKGGINGSVGWQQ